MNRPTTADRCDLPATRMFPGAVAVYALMTAWGGADRGRRHIRIHGGTGSGRGGSRLDRR